MYQILNGGYFTRHPQTFCMERPFGFEHYVFLFIRSEAELRISNRTYAVMPNSYLLIHPYTPYSYSNPKGPYMDDWIHFECTKEEINQFPDKMFHHPFSCNNPAIISTYLEQLLWENNFTPEPFRTETTHQLFQIILRHAWQDYKTQDSYHPYRFQLQKQRMSMQASPHMDYKAASMAKQLGISLSYYEHLYKTVFGISFRSDLISMRIDYAKELLSNTSLSIEQVAQTCGYSSEVHFYRQFLSKAGTTPGNYRNSTAGFPIKLEKN